MLRAPALRSVRSSAQRLSRPAAPRFSSSLSSATDADRVKIVEVGPRDGLQNEKAVISTEVKVELIERLVKAGLNDIEAGSFVSPKWVPQMASTADVLLSPRLGALRTAHPSLSLPVLVPNARGLSSLLELPQTPTPPTGEIAVFVSASEGFSRANLNCSVSESLSRLAPVFSTAEEHGLKVRGYVSVVLGCPFDGPTDPARAAEVAKELLDMGAYEVSLGDTIGVGVPAGWETLVGQCERRGVPARKLAAHCHDTYGTALASILHCVTALGIRTVDSSVAALGGCPYSPGATGNVATEDVLYALSASGVKTTALPDPVEGEAWSVLGGEWGQGERARRFEELCGVGEWISGQLGRENGSRVGKAMKSRRERREREQAKKAKL
ncbi:hypothetical protein JCM10449v2_002804 [Rhodotorula kratochvilovae]